MWRNLTFILMTAGGISLAQPPMPPVLTNSLHMRMMLAKSFIPTNPNDAKPLPAAAAVVPPTQTIWVGIQLACTNEFQVCTDGVGMAWSTVLATNNPIFWVQVPVNGQHGLIRNKLTFPKLAGPIGCLVSTNAAPF